MDRTKYDKVEVFNPISMFNTVGKELEEILELHNKDKYTLLKRLKWSEYSSMTRINKAELSIIDEYLNIDGSITNYLKEFQANYIINSRLADKSYKKSVKYFNKLKNVLPLLYDEYNEGIDILEDITNFFAKETEEEIIEESEELALMFRSINNDICVNEINLKAWLRRGEIEFKKIELGPYKKELLQKWVDDKEWLRHVQCVEYYMSLPNIFKTFGIALVYVPYLPKTAYGAIKWIEGKPLIQISDRNTDLATCWFTLFHEIGHVIFHENDDTFEGEISQTKKIQNSKEREANRFANEYLYNGDDLRKYVFSLPSNAFITSLELSNKFNVDRLFTSYWLIKAQINPKIQKRITINFHQSI